MMRQPGRDCSAAKYELCRAALFGAAAGGEAGVRRALEILLEELRRSMQLSGVASVADCGLGLLVPSAGTQANVPGS